MKIVCFTLIFLTLSNIATLVLLFHSRRSYRKLMQKSLRKDEECNNLIEPVLFEPAEVVDEHSEKLLQKLQICMEQHKLYLRPELNIQDLSRELGTNKTTYGPQNKPYNTVRQNFARKLPEKQRVILNFAGWAGQNKLYQNLYFGLIFDGPRARFL